MRGPSDEDSIGAGSAWSAGVNDYEKSVAMFELGDKVKIVRPDFGHPDLGCLIGAEGIVTNVYKDPKQRTYYEIGFPRRMGPRGYFAHFPLFEADLEPSERELTAEEKLTAIAQIYDSRNDLESGMLSSTHARYNLDGAIIDLDRTGAADPIIMNTLRRVRAQLGAIEKILAVPKKHHSEFVSDPADSRFVIPRASLDE